MPATYHHHRLLGQSLLWLVFLPGVVGCSGSDKPPPVEEETAVEDSAVAPDTGDSDLPIDRSFDGRYEGTFTAELQVEGMEEGHDICIGDTVIGVNALEAVQVQGVSNCTWQGNLVSMYPDWADPQAHYEGSMGAGGTLSGGVNFGPIQDTWEAQFTSETEGEGGFSGTVEFTETLIVHFQAEFSVTLASGAGGP